MKTIMAMAICLSLFAVGCTTEVAPTKPSTPNSAEPGQADPKTDTKTDTGSDSGY